MREKGGSGQLSGAGSLRGALTAAALVIRPPPKRNAGQWADAERREPAYAARGGRWETSVTPYWWPVLEAIDDIRTRQVTIIAAAQSGKTASCILNPIGHRYMDGPRVPAMLVVPTQKLARSMSQLRLKELIESTPGLNAIHSKGKADSVFEKSIAGVPLRLGWAGSATELSSHPVGLALVDELDRMTRDVGGEGDPLTLVRARTITYPQRLVIVCSTPTIQDASAIQDEFDSGSMEILEWPCLRCGGYFRPMSAQLRWPKGAAPADAAKGALVQCPNCGHVEKGAGIAEMRAAYRYHVYAKGNDGAYVPSDDQVVDPEHRSFWISGMVSPWSQIGELARMLCSAYRSNDAGKIQACLNTYFGELWTVRGERPPIEDVHKCRADYLRGGRPWGVQRVCCGIDVQSDRLVWVRCGFGAETAPKECWVLDYGEIYGNPQFDDPWLELQRLLRDRNHGIDLSLVDSGWKPGLHFVRPDHRIYAFCRRTFDPVFPCKGWRTRPTPIASQLKDYEEHGQKILNGVRLHHIDTTFFKNHLYGSMDGEQQDSGRTFHLPSDVDDDFCRQVTAEEMITKASGEMYYHCPKGRANHYLDATVYAMAANYLLDLSVELCPLGPQRALPLEGAAQLESPAPAGPARTHRSGFQRRGIV